MRPQPLLSVRSVSVASRWYQSMLGAVSGHGGDEYERLLVDGVMVLQLHALGGHHHHDAIGDPNMPLGNGVAVWFEVDDLDAVVERSRTAKARVVKAAYVNPDAGHRELWLRDPDGYLVVFAGQ